MVSHLRSLFGQCIKRAVALGLALCFASGLQAKEYFVAKTGADTNDGSSRGGAFLTVQKGLNALAPGDTLTILPGEYFEAVERKDLGNDEAETTIRAAIPGTVVLRGDVSPPEFKKVEGLTNVYVADFDRDAKSVNEGDTFSLLEPMPNLMELDFRPGSYFYDQPAKKLYISTTDFAPPSEHSYTISVLGKNGLFLDTPRRVVIDGLVVYGFNTNKEEKVTPGKFTVWGLLLYKANKCVVKNVEAYMNSGGIAISDSQGFNVIEDCIGAGNSAVFSGSGGNILIFTAKNDEIRRCLSYRSRDFGLRMYGAMSVGPSRILDSLGWGNSADMFIKGADVQKYGSAEGSVAVGAGHVFNLKNSLIGGSNIYRGKNDTPKDTIVLQDEKSNLDKDFVDVVNFDYRLQSGSRFRGKDGDADRGPFSYKANVFFLKPDGNDANDGLSVQKAWKTLARATSQLKSGDTLYLLNGTYEGGVQLSNVSGENPVSFRARGMGRVIINGPSQIKDSRLVDFQRINFQGPVQAEASKGVTFNNCRFLAGDFGLEARGCEGLRVTHNEFLNFTKAGLILDQDRDAFVSSNIFDNIKGVGIDLSARNEGSSFYSGYNSYTQAGKAWRIAQKDVSLAESGELYSAEIAPKYELENGFPVLTNPGAFAGKALGRQRLGFHQEWLVDRVRMTKPTVHSVTPTTANIEWLISERADCLVAWGETPSCENELTWEADHYGSFSLTNLKPGTTYYFRIKSMRWVFSMTRDPGPMPVEDPYFEVISFTTPTTEKQPSTYYVATDGDNAASGLTRDKAWRTVTHAAAQVYPGDTVLIASGTYAERVRVRATGTPDRPITFKSIPGEKVTFSSLGKLLDSAWVIDGKYHIAIDGFYFGQYLLSGGAGTSHRIFDLYGGGDISISRCFFDGRGFGYSNGFLTASQVKNLSVTNCVMISGFNQMGVRGCSGFRMEHNVLVCPMIQATMLAPPLDGKNLIRSNIFTDNSAFKVKVNLHEWGGSLADLIDENNCYFLRVPDQERELYWILSFVENGVEKGHTRMSVADFKRRVRPTTSMVADPKFAFFKASETYSEPYAVDNFFKKGPKLDFPDFFATNPEVTAQGIGLEPDKFRDFHFAAKATASAASEETPSETK